MIHYAPAGILLHDNIIAHSSQNSLPLFQNSYYNTDSVKSPESFAFMCTSTSKLSLRSTIKPRSPSCKISRGFFSRCGRGVEKSGPPGGSSPPSSGISVIGALRERFISDGRRRHAGGRRIGGNDDDDDELLVVSVSDASADALFSPRRGTLLGAARRVEWPGRSGTGSTSCSSSEGIAVDGAGTGRGAAGRLLAGLDADCPEPW